MKLELLNKSPLILDGAMGTMLMKSGLVLGKHPEALCFSHEDVVFGIHRQYIESGSDVIYTCTFGANRKKLSGSGYESRDIVKKATEIARKAAGGSGVKVALSIGPIGELLKPVGTLTFDEAYDIFKEMLVAGEEAGADLAVIETMSDLLEVKAGVLAAKENTSLPIFVSMTFEKTGRTFLGCSVEAMACALEEMGISAIGINCSLGPKEILPLAQRLVESTNLPVFVKANAGLPDPISGEYDISAGEFGEFMNEYAKIGIGIMGGCCGTSPEYIREINNRVAEVAAREKRDIASAVCAPSKVVMIKDIRATGEVILDSDIKKITTQAVKQVKAGADILKISTVMNGADAVRAMREAVLAVQGAAAVPLLIDSSDPDVIEAALRAFNGKGLVYLTGADENAGAILQAAGKYGAACIRKDA